jgi:hypothetical protein
MNDGASHKEIPVDAKAVSPLPQGDVMRWSREPQRPRSVDDDMRRLIHWLYTNNPFYVISAALVFIGLRMSFDTSGPAVQSASLMSGLTAYTLLLAATAWFLIRYGSLWQDVRTLLLLVVLMLLAISVSFDRALVEDPDLGIRLFLGGLAFAVVLNEVLLRGIGLRLPVGFRLPYYTMLALFFLYPLALRAQVREPGPALLWGMFGFCAAAGAVFLALLPAIRRGAGYVSDNGSPWQWPWYPWVLFGVLGLGVCLRAYYLCVSFHAATGSHTIFGFYFLVPFLWVVAYLLLEIGIVARWKKATYVALFSALGLVALALTACPTQANDLGFLKLFHDTVGTSPLFVTLLAVAAFYVIAWIRGVPEASLLLLLVVTALSVCGPNTFNPATTWGPYGWPVLAVGIVLLIWGIRKRDALRCLLGAWCVVFMLWVDLREMSFAAYHGAIPLHLLLACALAVGAAFRDSIGKAIQRLGAVALLLMVLIAALSPPSEIGNPPRTLLTAYPLVAAGAAVVYGFAVGNSWYYAAAIGGFCGWCAVPGWNLFCQARRTIAGLNYIALGAASFLVALLVSFRKMGVFRRLREHRRSTE